MKMYDKQKFEVDGVEWAFRQGQMPQGTLHSVTRAGKPIAIIKPQSWSRPIWDKNNAVLMTRSGPGEEWKEHSASDLKQAVRGGTDHALGYRRDRQIAAMENALKSPSKGIKASNDKGQKPIKFRKLKDLMEWQQRQKAQGKDINPNTAMGNNRGQGLEC